MKKPLSSPTHSPLSLNALPPIMSSPGLFREVFGSMLAITKMWAIVDISTILFSLPSRVVLFYAYNSSNILSVSAERLPETHLQDIVLWDENSLFIREEGAIIFSGEFHPFRPPSPGLWLDIFQKIKALGYSTVSFYVD